MITALKQDCGRRLRHAIEYQNTKEFERVLGHIVSLNDADITLDGRHLIHALDRGLVSYAERLIDKGADPNYVSTYLPVHSLLVPWSSIHKRFAVQFLLQHGSHVPRAIPNQHTRLCVEQYIYRDWEPSNHPTWPVLLRRQIVAVLSCRIVIPQHLVYYLIKAIASAHFVFIN